VLCWYLNGGRRGYLGWRALNSAVGTTISGGLAFYASGVKESAGRAGTEARLANRMVSWVFPGLAGREQGRPQIRRGV
jgi:hypothetical protein